MKLNGETSDTNDNVKTKISTKHMKFYTSQVNVHVVFLLVLFSFATSHSFIAHHIAWLKSACLPHLIHAWSERALFDFELSIPSNFFLPFSINL